jgi:hypothetical protein
MIYRFAKFRSNTKAAALMAALAVTTLNLKPGRATAAVVSTNNLPATPELRAIDAGMLVDFRTPAPTGKAPGQEHCTVVSGSFSEKVGSW